MHFVFRLCGGCLTRLERMTSPVAENGQPVNKERHIVDVRDVFSSSKTDSGNASSPLGVTGGRGGQGGRARPGRYLPPGVHTQDAKHNTHTQDVFSKAKLVTSGAGHSDVLFGNKASLQDVSNKNNSISRKKRSAPKPPVLVDIDVGISEQINGSVDSGDDTSSSRLGSHKSDNSGSDKQKQGSPGVAATPAPPPPRPPPPSQTAIAKLSLQGRQYTPAKQKAPVRQHKSKLQSYSSRNRDDTASDFSDSDFMSSSSRSNIGSERSGCTGSDLSSQRKPFSLDNSSSSGFASLLDTSSDAEQFKTKLVITSSGNKPVITQANGSADVPIILDDYDLVSSSRKPIRTLESESGVETEDDLDSSGSSNFDEDEMTMDFEDEEEAVEARRMILYREYHGEDFSQYLNDDEDNPRPKKQNSKQRKHKSKKKSKKVPSGNKTGGESPFSGAYSNKGNTSHSYKNSTGKKGSLKLKLGHVFALPGTDRPKTPESSGGSVLHNFSYADSKMGMLSPENDIDDQMLTLRSRSRRSSLGSAKLEGDSDLAPPENESLTKRWWSKDMLSAKTLDSNSDIMFKARRQDSPEDVDISSSYSADSINPAIQTQTKNYHISNTSDEDKKFNDFESYRKNNFLYSSKGSKNSNPNTSLWRKISRSFKKGQFDYNDNTTDNPLSLSATDGDIQL